NSRFAVRSEQGSSTIVGNDFGQRQLAQRAPAMVDKGAIYLTLFSQEEDFLQQWDQHGVVDRREADKVAVQNPDDSNASTEPMSACSPVE
ncbi:MAG: hypothetical protein ACJ8OJ_04400, partial [Povalibacter sp.]